MSTNDSKHSIRVPVRNCDSILIRGSQKSFTFGLEWPINVGDHPNLVINIFENSRMEPPGPDITIHNIDDQESPGQQLQSFLSKTSFNGSLIPSNHQEDVTSTTTANQMISSQVQMPRNMNMMSISDSFPSHNPPPYSSAQSTGVAQTNANNNQDYFSSLYSGSQTQSLGQPSPMNSSVSMTNPTISQPFVCQCPRPELQHEINCSVFSSNRPPMIHQQRLPNSQTFNPSMHFSPAPTLLPSIQMLKSQSKQNGVPLNNGSFMSAPLIRPSRMSCSLQQPIMPRASSDVNSVYYSHTLQQQTIPTQIVQQPMVSRKRSAPEDTTTNQTKTPKRRVNKPKTLRIPPQNTTHEEKSSGETAESQTQQTSTSVSKTTSPATTNGFPSTPTSTPARQSIRIVPEELSPQEALSNESNKTSPVSNSHSTSSPMETFVRSPVSIDPSIFPEEILNDTKKSQLNQYDEIIEQVAREGPSESLIKILREPKSVEIIPNQVKKDERKRRGGRPAKNQQIIYPPPRFSSNADNLFDGIHYADSAPVNSHLASTLGSHICDNNLERITPISTEFGQMDDLLHDSHRQTVPDFTSVSDSSNGLTFDQHCFDHFNDPFSILTTASLVTAFTSAQDNLFTDLLSENLNLRSSNGPLWQEDQVSSSVMSPPNS